MKMTGWSSFLAGRVVILFGRPGGHFFGRPGGHFLLPTGWSCYDFVLKIFQEVCGLGPYVRA